MEGYKIKELLKDFVQDDHQDEVFYKEYSPAHDRGFYYCIIDGVKIYTVYSDYTFEKVEEESGLKVTGLHLEWLQPSQHVFKYTVRFETNKEIGVKMNGNNIEITECDGVAFAESSSKVKERIKVIFHGALAVTVGEIDDNEEYPNGIGYTLKINTDKQVDWDKLRPTFEAYVNGDMVENDKPIENQYFNREEYGFKVSDGVLEVFPLKTESKRILDPKERREIERHINSHALKSQKRLFDDFNGNTSYVLKNSNAMEDLWSKVLNNDLHTTDQMIEIFNEWVRKEEVRSLLIDKMNGRQHLINSFNKFINTK